MKFVYTKGQYRQFRGHVFAWHQPTDIQDRATIEACLRDPTFERIEDAVRQEEVPQAPAPQVIAREVIDPDACPKCGRVVKQGRYMHEKFCKGDR